MCALYGVTGRQRQRLIERVNESPSRSHWYSAGVGGTEQASSFLQLELEASSITSVMLTLVPGIVQTPEYAREIISLGRHSASHAEWMVRTRLGRQSLLSSHQAPEVRLIIDEPALRRRVGSAQVMRDQLGQLLRASKRKNVMVRIIPFSAGAHPAVDGSFVKMEFPEREPHVYLESRGGGLSLSGLEQVQPYLDMIEDLEAALLSVEESERLITEIKETMTDG